MVITASPSSLVHTNSSGKTHCRATEVHYDTEKYDTAFLGIPFDTGTSHRPGARLGTSGIRQGSRRLNLYYVAFLDLTQIEFRRRLQCPVEANPFDDKVRILKCSDVLATLHYPDAQALTNVDKRGLSGAGKTLPPVITLLRSINKAYGPVLWRLFILIASGEKSMDDGGPTAQPKASSGSPSDVATIKNIRDRIGTDNPVYLWIDIDTLDLAFEPIKTTDDRSQFTRGPSSSLRVPVAGATRCGYRRGGTGQRYHCGLVDNTGSFFFVEVP
ncbi:agmatinase [Penicillium cf. viridicatum]|uniref:Agmatinase n=1 Tax=Penicillium cf. viridicatum TaxID=2972119 RepID=A0A9W9N6J7_9EURO|nr:agmatinase [Penicillium cf. viridicatum]